MAEHINRILLLSAEQSEQSHLNLYVNVYHNSWLVHDPIADLEKGLSPYYLIF